MFILFLSSPGVSIAIRIIKNFTKIIAFISGIISSIATFFVPDPVEFISNSYLFIKDSIKFSYNSLLDFIGNNIKKLTADRNPKEKIITFKELKEKINLNESFNLPQERKDKVLIRNDSDKNLFESLRAKYAKLTINGQEVDESWLKGYWLYFTLGLITLGGIILVTIFYYDENGHIKEVVMKLTGLSALHRLVYKKSNQTDDLTPDNIFTAATGTDPDVVFNADTESDNDSEDEIEVKDVRKRSSLEGMETPINPFAQSRVDLTTSTSVFSEGKGAGEVRYHSNVVEDLDTPRQSTSTIRSHVRYPSDASEGDFDKYFREPDLDTRPVSRAESDVADQLNK
jgi:hypothetical protein